MLSKMKKKWGGDSSSSSSSTSSASTSPDRSDRTASQRWRGSITKVNPVASTAQHSDSDDDSDDNDTTKKLHPLQRSTRDLVARNNSSLRAKGRTTATAPPTTTSSSGAGTSRYVQSFLGSTEEEEDDGGTLVRREHTLDPSSLQPSSRHASPQWNRQRGSTVIGGIPSSSREASPSTTGPRVASSSPKPSGLGALDGEFSTASPAAALAPSSPSGLKQCIKMEYGDEYFGDSTVVSQASVQQGQQTASNAASSGATVNADTSTAGGGPLLHVPHGSGTLQSSSGKHCYVGEFMQRERHGLGKLLTDRFVLWCRWQNNRPDFTSSARLDITNGDKYFGYLTCRTDVHQFQKLSKHHPQTMSKFSMWVNTTTYVKERWGELVSSSGHRYFGQWEDDLKHGFGCMMCPNGDRYVGMFSRDAYDGAGVLFVAAASAATGGGGGGGRPSGGQSASPADRGASGFPAVSTTTMGKTTSPSTSSPPASSHLDDPTQPALRLDDYSWKQDELLLPPRMFLNASPNGILSCGGGGSVTKNSDAQRYPVVYDGQWSAGVFVNEEHPASVTFPCRTRIEGYWSDMTHTADGRVVCPKRPRTYFGESGAGGGGQDSTLLSRRWIETCQWEPLLSGSSESSKQRSLHLARPLRSRILKCSDKNSVVVQLRRFLKEDSSSANSVKIFRRCFYFFYGTCGVSHEIGGGLANNPLGWCQFRSAYGGCIHRGRGRVISSVDIDAALGDIFSMVGSLHRWALEALGPAAVEKVQELDAETVLPRMALDMILHEVSPVLVNLYVQVYRHEEDAVQVALKKLRNITLDDLGVRFGRNASSDRLFDPYADAARCLEELGHSKTLSEMVHALTAWSKEIDTSTKLAQVSLHDEQLNRITNVVRERRATIVSASNVPPSVQRSGATMATNDDVVISVHPPPQPEHGGGTDTAGTDAAGTADDGSIRGFALISKQGSTQTDVDLSNVSFVAAAREHYDAMTVLSSRSLDDSHLTIEDNHGGGRDSAGSAALSAMQFNHSFATPSGSPIAFKSNQGSPKSHMQNAVPPPTEALTHSVVGAAQQQQTFVDPHWNERSHPPHHHSRHRLTKFLDAAAVEAGSADDLIPIHQYVLIRGATRVPHLFATTKLLVDISAEESVVDGTSQDSFCITTLHACVTTLTQLDPRVRDERCQQPLTSHLHDTAAAIAKKKSDNFDYHIITPVSVFEKRVEEVVQSFSDDPSNSGHHVTDATAQWLPPLVERLGMIEVLQDEEEVLLADLWSPEELHRIVHRTAAVLSDCSTDDDNDDDDDDNDETPMAEDVDREDDGREGKSLFAVDVTNMMTLATRLLHTVGIALVGAPPSATPATKRTAEEMLRDYFMGTIVRCPPAAPRHSLLLPVAVKLQSALLYGS